MTESVRVSMRVPGTSPMPELMSLIQSIEAAGFDGAGILDSQMISRDTFVVLGQAATRHVAPARCFPAVTNPFTRHASVLAGAIQTVEELAPGPGEVRDRHRLHVREHDRPEGGDARRDARVHRHRQVAPRRQERRLRRDAGPAGLRRGAADPGPDGGVGAEGHRAGRRDRRRRAAPRRLQPRHRRAGARRISSAARGGAAGGSRTSRSSGRCGRARRRRRRRRAGSRGRPRCTGACCAGAATGSSPPA